MQNHRKYTQLKILQNKISLTKSLHEAYLKTSVEAETLDEENKKKIVEDDFELIEATINGIIKQK